MNLLELLEYYRDMFQDALASDRSVNEATDFAMKTMLSMTDLEVAHAIKDCIDDKGNFVDVDGKPVSIKFTKVEPPDDDDDDTFLAMETVADTHYRCTGCNTTPCDCSDELITNTGSLK